MALALDRESRVLTLNSRVLNQNQNHEHCFFVNRYCRIADLLICDIASNSWK